MEDFRTEQLEQELFLLSEKLAALTDQVQRQRPLPGYNMAFESTEHGTVIGQAPAGGIPFIYNGDFTLIITEQSAGTAAPVAAVVDLQNGADSANAGYVYAFGLGGVYVPRYSFPVQSGGTQVSLRSTVSGGQLVAEIVTSTVSLSEAGGLYDIVEIGYVSFNPATNWVRATQNWRSGSRYIEYRWW